MCYSRILSGSRSILDLGILDDLFSEELAEVFRSAHVNGSAQHLGQLAFHAGQSQQAGLTARLELHEHIDIAVRTEIVSEHGAKEGKAA